MRKEFLRQIKEKADHMDWIPVIFKGACLVFLISLFLFFFCYTENLGYLCLDSAFFAILFGIVQVIQEAKENLTQNEI